MILYDLFYLFMHFFRQIVLYQILQYGNYGGIARPLWPSQKNNIKQYKDVLCCIPPINGVDMSCMIHDIDCRLARNVRNGRINWRKRREADYKFIRRLEMMHIPHICENIHRYLILFIFRSFTIIMYDLGFRNIVHYTKDREFIWDNVPNKKDYDILKDIREEKNICFKDRYLSRKRRRKSHKY